MDMSNVNETISEALFKRTDYADQNPSDGPAMRQAVDKWWGDTKPNVGDDYFAAHKPR